jgi:hypothetical protein
VCWCVDGSMCPFSSFVSFFISSFGTHVPCASAFLLVHLLMGLWIHVLAVLICADWAREQPLVYRFSLFTEYFEGAFQAFLFAFLSIM